MKDYVEIQINEAIENANFTKFFSLIPKINSSYERHRFTLEAIAVARQQKNISILKQFTEIEFDRWDTERLFEQILQALVELNAVDTAFGIVIRNENKQLETGEGWYLLAKALLTKTDLAEIKQILGYIRKPYQQVEIIKACLAKITLPAQVLIWLEWFELYSQAETYVSLDFKAAISAVADYQDFNSICSQLQKIKPSASKQQLLRKLYLYLFTKQELEKLTQLNPLLPEEINWLIKIPQLLEDESQFHILAKLEYSEATPLIPLAVESLLTRQQHHNDEDLAEFISTAANLSEKYQELIIETTCDICLKNLKLDTIINLLPLLNKYTKTNIVLALLEHKLRIPQYQAILQQLDSLEVPSQRYGYTSDEETILKKIPAQLIADEYKRRAKTLIAESQEKFAKTNHIHSKHSQYQDIVNAISQLLRYKQHAIAFELCQKLVPSKIRDSYLMQFFHNALVSQNFTWASEIAKLLSQKENQQALSQFLQHYQTPNYRKAFKVLIKFNHKVEFPNFLLLDCVDNILAEDDSIAAANFLMDNGIFNLSESYSDEDSSKIIKRSVVRLIIVRYKNDKAITKLATSLKQRNIKKFKFYLFEELLATNHFTTAIKLLNAWLEETHWGQKQLPYRLEKLKEKITKYIKELEPSIECLNSLALLEEKSLQSTLIHELFRNMTEDLSIGKIQLIAAIPNENIKTDYLIKAIIFCLEKNETALAKWALLYLPKDNQLIWSQILMFAEQDNIVDILNIILSEPVEEASLLRWTIERWFSGSTPSYLLRNLLNFCEWLSQLNSEEQKFFAKQQIYQTLISQTFYQWHTQLLNAEAYLNFLAGIDLLLPYSEKLKIHIDFFSPLRGATKIMLEEQSYDEAFIALQLLIKYEKSFSDYFFNEIFAIVLKNNALEFADRLLTLIQSNQGYWLEETLIKLSEVYLAKANYKKVIDLLKPQKEAYMIQEQVTDWIINLIKADKITAAISFIDALLPTANETYFIEIIELLIVKKQLTPTLKYLQDKIKIPGTKLRLQNKLKQAYLAKLKEWLGEDPVQHLLFAQQKLAKFIEWVKNPEKQKLANQLKNEIITDLRSQLDKAFLAFYRSKYGEPPLVRGNHLNVFFPVIPDLQNKSVKQRLNDYFQYMLLQPNFATQNPELFRYLEYIQPLGNNDYIWLKQLYDLANKDKHDTDLPLKPEIEGVQIDMLLYLPKLIDGITELLLKLNYPRISLEVIQNLQFSQFVPLVLVTTPELKISDIFQAAGNIQDTNNSQNTIPKLK